MRENQHMQQLLIQFINYVWYYLHIRHYIAILTERS
jgi:hypothetical protein